jgi:hypothetical protein
MSQVYCSSILTTRVDILFYSVSHITFRRCEFSLIDRYSIRCIIATQLEKREGVYQLAMLPPEKKIREEIHPYPNYQTLPQRPLIAASIYLPRTQCTRICTPLKTTVTHQSISTLPPFTLLSNGPKLNPIPNSHSTKLQSQYSPFGINALPRSGNPKRKTA